jgi:hypothetical protein
VKEALGERGNGASPAACADGGESPLASEAVRLIRALPDIRDEKVGPIQVALDSGTYRVEGEKVAGRILTEAVMDRRIRAG